MQWLEQHAQLISALVGVGTLLVWVVYLQVFLSSYRRTNKAMILINLTGGSGLDARCLVANMSVGPLYLYAITLTLQGAGETVTCPVTELDGVEHWQEPSDLQLWTRQGPLKSGKLRDMGTIEALVDHVRSKRGAAAARAIDRLERLELTVVGTLASDDLVVAASRAYDVVTEGGASQLRARSIGAHQIRSRRQRRATAAALEREL